MLTAMCLGCGQSEADVYLFSYFMGNGEDGLHIASSRDGLHWEALNGGKSLLQPEVGQDQLMRDPCIIKGPDGEFHMVWTVSWGEKGIGYAHSMDLINWSEQQYIPVMEHEADARNCWAPELYYDEDSEKYLICWATTIPGKYPETDTLGDNGYNHRMYYSTTEDFKTFSPTALLYNDGFNVIDATLTKHEGEYIMFLKDETLKPEAEKNIRIAKSTLLSEGYSPASAPISKHWVEGPTVGKVGERWLVYFDQYTEHRMGAIASTDLENWTDISEEISFPKGTRHGTFIKVKEGVLKKLEARTANKARE